MTDVGWYAEESEWKRVTPWATAFSAAIWLPLLALNAGYPSIEEVVRTPEIRVAVGYSAIIGILTAAVIAVMSGLAVRFAARWTETEAPGLVRGGAFCATAVASALFAGSVAILVIRGPSHRLIGDLEGLVLVLLFSAGLGGVIGAGAVVLANRTSYAWIPIATGIAALAVWAHLIRVLLRGTAASDAALLPWAIAAGVTIIGCATALEAKQRVVAIVAGVVVIAAGSLPAIRLRAGHPEPAGPASSAAGSPNVVVLVIDSWRFGATDLAGQRKGMTPRLAALASNRSTVFQSAMTPATGAIPSIKALITGRPASHFGVVDWGRRPPPEDSWTLARAFRERGYATAAFVANDVIDSAGFETGYERYWCAGAFANVQRSFFLQVMVARRNYWRAARLAERYGIGKTRGDSIVDEIEEWIDRRSGRPFFTYVHLVEPHWPYEDRGYGFIPEPLKHLPIRFSHTDLARLQPGDPTNAKLRGTRPMRELVGRYREEVRDADRLIGRIVDALAERQLFDQTLLIVTANHGVEFFEHDGFGYGHDVFQELVHVPLVMKWPDVNSPRNPPPIVSTPVSLLDIAPTLTELMGLTPSEKPFAGRSLRGVLEGRIEPAGVRAESVVRGTEARMSYQFGSLKARFAFDVRRLPSEAKLVQVFDLEADAGEAHPLEEKDVRVGEFLARARPALDAWWKDARKATGSRSSVERAGETDETH